MKKAKMLPSILMLVLCVGVLAMGVYAAMPVSHSITGSINVTAAGAEVEIIAYLDDSDDTTADVAVSSTTPTPTRVSSEVELNDGAITFNCDNAAVGEQDKIPAKKLYLSVKNNSSIDLGAYYLAGTVGESGTNTGNIATTKSLSNGVVTADFSGYTQIPAGQTRKMYCILTLNQLSSDEVNISLTGDNSINLNIEPYDETLLTAQDTTSSINFVNDKNLAVKTSCTTINASETQSATANFAAKNWSLNSVAFSDTEYDNGELALPTIKMQMQVKNSDSVPVKVSITEKTSAGDAVRTTVLGNGYIPAGTTKEVSVQFQAIFDRGVREDDGEYTKVSTAPTIADNFNYEVKIEKADTAAALVINTAADNDTMVARGFRYYINFGTNPATSLPLRWFIWAEDDGRGNPTTLSGVPKVGDNKVYYFISEYILSTSNAESYDNICFQNGYSYSNGDNIYNDQGSDYAGSNLRDYLNGLSVRAAGVDAAYDESEPYSEQDVYMPNGAYINFYKEFGLNEGANAAILSKIIGRKLGTSEGGLYYDMEYEYECGLNADTTYSFPTNNTNVSEDDEDLFWTISYKEYYNLIRNGNNDNAVAYLSRNASSASIWWLRSPGSLGSEWYVDDGGYDNSDVVGDRYVGSRPAFKIQIQV